MKVDKNWFQGWLIGFACGLVLFLPKAFNW